MPQARCRPVPESPICAPVTSGGPSRKPVVEAAPPRTLRDVLVDLAVLVRAGAEALDRRDDHARVGLVDVLPSQSHAVERAGREILHQHVAVLDQTLEDFLALGMLRVDRDRALVAVEHREVERVLAFYVTELTSCDVADAGPLDLDAVGAHVAEKLRASRARLHMREVEDLHAVERLAGLAERLGRRRRQSVRRAEVLATGLRGAAARVARRAARSARCSAATRLRSLAAAFLGARNFLAEGLALRPGAFAAAWLVARRAAAAFLFTRFAALTFFLVLAIVVPLLDLSGVRPAQRASSCWSDWAPAFAGTTARNYFFFSALCGLRLPMRPDSLPAPGSSTALIRVGLPEFIASFTARFNSSGDVALTPTPPKASIILS